MQTRRQFVKALGTGIPALVSLSAVLRAADTKLPPVAAYLQRAGYYPVELDRDDSNHFLVAVQLGDRKTTFVVDTGWTFTSANRKLLKNVKTLGELGATLHDSLLGRVESKSAHLVEKLSLGEAEFLNQPVLASSTDTGDAARWQGVLGLDFLLRHHAIIDCLTGWLCLRGTEPTPASRQAITETLTRSGYVEVPLKPDDAFMLFCQPRLNGEPTTLMVDTGSIFSLLDDGRADRLKLARQEVGAAIRGVGKIGASRLDTARLARWELGEASAKSISIGVADLQPWFMTEREVRQAREEKQELMEVDGFLGADHLYQFGAVIDCRQRRMWLLKDRMAGTGTGGGSADAKKR